MRSRTVAALALIAGCLRLGAAELGSKAPEIKVSRWIKGGPLDLKSSVASGTNVTVVEFWATWCPPCRTTIPHLSELQAKFKNRGVTIVGISDEPITKVKPFVDRLADQMNYAVAIDDTRSTTTAYMQGFNVSGIPHAFVVDAQGRVAWHGHPMAGLDRVLERVLSGKYNIDAARRGPEIEKSIRSYFELVADGEHTPRSKELGQTIFKDGADNTELMNQFAWILLTHPRLKNPDIDLAAQIAKSTYDLTGGQDASVIDTYARALFVRGKVSEAVELQKKAVEICTSPDLRPRLEKSLKEFQARLNSN